MLKESSYNQISTHKKKQLFLEQLCAFALSPTLATVSTNTIIFYVSVWPKP